MLLCPFFSIHLYFPLIGGKEEGGPVSQGPVTPLLPCCITPCNCKCSMCEADITQERLGVCTNARANTPKHAENARFKMDTGTFCCTADAVRFSTAQGTCATA